MSKLEKFGEPLAEVTLEYLAWVAPMVSTEATRYYLNGIAIQAHPTEGAFIVATDGHCMAIVHDKAAVVKQDCIWKVSKDLLRMSARVGGDFKPPKVKLYDPVAEVSGGAFNREIVIAETIDGTFPDWRKVVPTSLGQPLKYLCFNPEIIAKFTFKVRKSAGGLSLVGTGDTPEGSPMSVTKAGAPEFLGLIMPMRGDPKTQLPEWLAPSEMKAAA